MATRPKAELLEDAIDEYVQTYECYWAPKTAMKYKSVLSLFLAWVKNRYIASGARGPGPTTDCLDFPTLLAYVAHLRDKPAVRGVWRGRPDAAELSARTVPPEQRRRSLNSVNSDMRAIRTFVLELHNDNRIPTNPFHVKHRRGKRVTHPLLPTETRPKKAASKVDIQTVERGCVGRSPQDLRDRAIVAVLKTTMARNSAVRLLRLEDVDMERNIIRFPPEKEDHTYQVALLPEAKAAIVAYLKRGRPHFLSRYPVRGYEGVVIDDPGYLFLARDNGRGDGVAPLTDGGLSTMLNRRYHAAGGTIASFRSHRVRHGMATIAANNGMPLAELGVQLGQKDPSSVQQYAVVQPEALGRRTLQALQAAGMAGGRGRKRSD